MSTWKVSFLALALSGLTLAAFAPVSLHAAPAPPLQWVVGQVGQILVQPNEKFYTFSLQGDDGTTTFVRFCDPSTGAETQVTTGSPDYDLLKEAYFRGLRLQVGMRSFGYDPQAGGQKNCLDRLTLIK
jgi:hypothetical protein